MWVGQAQRATAAGERIFEVMDEPEGVEDRVGAIELPPGPGAIRFEGVGFGYADDRRVLHDIELDVASGRTIALIGAHRLGQDDARVARATLLRRLGGTRPGRRRRRARGHPTLAPPRDRRHLAGSLPLLGDGEREHRLRRAATRPTSRSSTPAQAAQAHEFVEALPQGYDTIIGERGITLSGGQRQRLAIARALVIDPRILILDDATASVDATTEAKIRAGLTEAMRGRTTIIIAHRLSTIALADEIVVLDHGRITARGTQAELLATNPVYQEIHEHGLLQGLLRESA